MNIKEHFNTPKAYRLTFQNRTNSFYGLPMYKLYNRNGQKPLDKYCRFIGTEDGKAPVEFYMTNGLREKFREMWKSTPLSKDFRVGEFLKFTDNYKKPPYISISNIINYLVHNKVINADARIDYGSIHPGYAFKTDNKTLSKIKKDVEDELEIRILDYYTEISNEEELRTTKEDMERYPKLDFDFDQY